MPMISLRQLLDHAAEHAYGVPAFNINNMEQVQAIMQAADATDSPVILQASAGARKYAGEAFLRYITIREHGGEVKETYGVPVEEIQEGIRNGVRKVNIDTDIRIAMTGAMRRVLWTDRTELDPRKMLKAATAAAQALCKDRFEAFWCAGQASRIRPLPLEFMAHRYTSKRRVAAAA